MTWVELRSRRDPAVWAPLLIALAGVAALGVAAHLSVSEGTDAIERLAAAEPERAVTEAVAFIRRCELVLGAATLLFAAYLGRLFQLGAREQRLPPSGWWSFGAWRVATGAPPG